MSEEVPSLAERLAAREQVLKLVVADLHKNLSHRENLSQTLRRQYINELESTIAASSSNTQQEFALDIPSSILENFMYRTPRTARQETDLENVFFAMAQKTNDLLGGYVARFTYGIARRVNTPHTVTRVISLDPHVPGPALEFIIDAKYNNKPIEGVSLVNKFLGDPPSNTAIAFRSLRIRPLS